MNMQDDDRRTRLCELRDLLADAIRSADANMLPQLAGQYRACLADLAALGDATEELSPTEALRARRQADRGGLKAV